MEGLLVLFQCEEGELWRALVLLLGLVLVAMLCSSTHAAVKEQSTTTTDFNSNKHTIQPQNNENGAPAPYDALAHKYDATFCDTPVGTLLRQQTRVALEKAFVSRAPPSSPVDTGVVLELSCGTGQDALWLAEQHHIKVIATDISEGMLQTARAKLQSSSLICNEEWRPIFQKLDIHNLEEESFVLFQQQELQHRRIIGVFSNFGGMNNVSPDCVRHTAKILAKLLPPGAKVILVIMGRFCLVESLYCLFVKFNWQRAFRRMRSSPTQGVAVRIRGRGDHKNHHKVFFHSLTFVQEAFLATSAFCLTGRRAIGVTLPPSLWSHSASRKIPGWVLIVLDAIDTVICRLWPFVNCGDHYLVEFERMEDR